MATSSCSGVVTQSASGSVLTFTDTGSYNPPITSRMLNIYDYNGNLIQTYNMGSSLTQTFDITADSWFRFILTVVDSTGTFTCTVDYLSTAFYQNAFSNAIAGQTCPNSDFYGVIFNLNLSQDFYMAALRFFIGGFAVSANNMITQANDFVTTPFYAI